MRLVPRILWMTALLVFLAPACQPAPTEFQPSPLPATLIPFPTSTPAPVVDATLNRRTNSRSPAAGAEFLPYCHHHL